MSQIDDNRNYFLDQIKIQRVNLNTAATVGANVIGFSTWLQYAPLGFDQATIDMITRAHVKNLNNVIDFARDVTQWEQDLVSYFGSPDGLRAAATAVATDVSGAAATLAGDVSSTRLKALFESNWDSDAREQYEASFDEQSDSVERIVAYANSLVDSLNGHADTLEGYYDGLGLVIVAVLVGIVAFIASLATGPGVVAGLVVLGVTLVAAVVQGVAAYNEFNRAANATIASMPQPATWAATTFSV